MAAIINAVFFLLQAGLFVFMCLLIAYAISTWLVAFEIINMRNRMAFQAVNGLEKFANAILRPIRRIIPSLGGIDFSAMIVILLVIALRSILLPELQRWLLTLVGTPV
ncbi:MAG: YggT family protein [Caulobacteraceae bacterium]